MDVNTEQDPQGLFFVLFVCFFFLCVCVCFLLLLSCFFFFFFFFFFFYYRGFAFFCRFKNNLQFPDIMENLANGVDPVAEIVYDGFPPTGGHANRYINFDADEESVYVSIGAPCNMCVPDSKKKKIYIYIYIYHFLCQK